MTTITIETVQNIIIEKGTVIPFMYPTDNPIGYDIFIPTGSKLSKCNGSCFVILDNHDNTCNAIPYHPAIFMFICRMAIEHGSKRIVTEDNTMEFKMFSTITENRITPEERNYITSFFTETLMEAEIKAVEFAKGLGSDFTYIIRE